jgi:hypothetical protein
VSMFPIVGRLRPHTGQDKKPHLSFERVNDELQIGWLHALDAFLDDVIPVLYGETNLENGVKHRL